MIHSTALNSSDNLPYNHHSSDDVYWRGGENILVYGAGVHYMLIQLHTKTFDSSHIQYITQFTIASVTHITIMQVISGVG